MRNKLMLVAVLVAALFVPAKTEAVPLVSLVPSFQSGDIGDTFSVDLVISGLEGATVGGFDMDIAFNSAILGNASVVFGNGLGPAITISDIAGGTIDLFQLSMLSLFGFNDQLLALQGGSSFTLATLTFLGQANGLSPLTITQAIFADGDGNALQVGTANGSIQIGDVTPVPEPGTMLLLGSGAVAAALRHRRQKRQLVG